MTTSRHFFVAMSEPVRPDIVDDSCAVGELMFFTHELAHWVSKGYVVTKADADWIAAAANQAYKHQREMQRQFIHGHYVSD